MTLADRLVDINPTIALLSSLVVKAGGHTASRFIKAPKDSIEHQIFEEKLKDNKKGHFVKDELSQLRAVNDSLKVHLS